jgi:peptide/nickel transport system ATP-binding protein
VTAMSTPTPLLSITDLHVRFPSPDGDVLAVGGLNLEIRPGEMLALVGESGCGKTLTALSVLGLAPPTARVSGSIRLSGRELIGLPPKQLRDIRGKDIAMVFQEPMSSLNPVFTIGRQIDEVIRRHESLGRSAARARSIELLDLVGVPEPARRAKEYPHQLSGGMRQRVMIAMAIACSPQLIIADEPTTALDATIQAQVLALFEKLRADFDSAVLVITHDLGVVAEIAERVVVIYAGYKVEQAPVHQLFAHPRHPYTAGLLGAVPMLGAVGENTVLAEIPGTVPIFDDVPEHCPFVSRCGRAQLDCHEAFPAWHTTGPDGEVACAHQLEVTS